MSTYSLGLRKNSVHTIYLCCSLATHKLLPTLEQGLEKKQWDVPCHDLCWSSLALTCEDTPCWQLFGHVGVSLHVLHICLAGS